MKKVFAILAAFMLTFSFAMAAGPGGDDGYGNSYSGIDKTGPYNPDDKTTVGKDVANDYSFDNAMGTYIAFVICKIDIAAQDENIYLGWLNPDGVKDISNQPMMFSITGGNGWPFEASTKVGSQVINGGHIANRFNGAAGAPTHLDNVYITGGKWYYNNGNGFQTVGAGELTNEQLQLSGTPGMFYGSISYNNGQWQFGDPTYDKGAWNYGNPCPNCSQREYNRNCDNACQGKGTLKYVPGLLWASPDAEEGYYEFDVYAEVDYLTFVSKNLVPTGNTYNDPSTYTAGQ